MQNVELTDGAEVSNLPSTFVMLFGENKSKEFGAVVARNHMVTQITVDDMAKVVTITTAPTTIRPYTEKMPKDYTQVTDDLYAPLTPPPATNSLTNNTCIACGGEDKYCKYCEGGRLA